MNMHSVVSRHVAREPEVAPSIFYTSTPLLTTPERHPNLPSKMSAQGGLFDLGVLDESDLELGRQDQLFTPNCTSLLYEVEAIICD